MYLRYQILFSRNVEMNVFFFKRWFLYYIANIITVFLDLVYIRSHVLFSVRPVPHNCIKKLLGTYY